MGYDLVYYGTWLAHFLLFFNTLVPQLRPAVRNIQLDFPHSKNGHIKHSPHSIPLVAGVPRR